MTWIFITTVLKMSKFILCRSLYMHVLEHHKTSACTEHKQTYKRSIHTVGSKFTIPVHAVKSSTCQHRAATVFDKQCTCLSVNWTLTCFFNFFFSLCVSFFWLLPKRNETMILDNSDYISYSEGSVLTGLKQCSHFHNTKQKSITCTAV
jgi:hypothetical protein